MGERVYLTCGTTDIDGFLRMVRRKVEEAVEGTGNPHMTLYTFGIEIRPMREGNPIMNMYEE